MSKEYLWRPDTISIQNYTQCLDDDVNTNTNAVCKTYHKYHNTYLISPFPLGSSSSFHFVYWIEKKDNGEIISKLDYKSQYMTCGMTR